MSGESGVEAVGVETMSEPPVDVAALRQRLLHAELRTAAVRAGMVDLDGIRLLDMDKVPLDADGAPVDAGAAMAGLRAAKPWLFAGSTSSGAPAPRAGAGAPRTAMEMSVDEWRLARAALLRR